LISATGVHLQFSLQQNVSLFVLPEQQATTFIAVLARVQAFLPQLEASNAILTQRVQTDPKSVDIENIEEGEEQYIEMVSYRNMSLVIIDS
jgi:Domain of unknown function (DUF4598)